MDETRASVGSRAEQILSVKRFIEIFNFYKKTMLLLVCTVELLGSVSSFDVRILQGHTATLFISKNEKSPISILQ